jgi:hypothetical protein
MIVRRRLPALVIGPNDKLLKVVLLSQIDHATRFHVCRTRTCRGAVQRQRVSRVA